MNDSESVEKDGDDTPKETAIEQMINRTRSWSGEKLLAFLETDYCHYLKGKIEESQLPIGGESR